MKLLAGQDLEQGRDLASHPTLSRFENSIRRGNLLEAAKALGAAVIERQRRRQQSFQVSFQTTPELTLNILCCCQVHPNVIINTSSANL